MQEGSDLVLVALPPSVVCGLARPLVAVHGGIAFNLPPTPSVTGNGDETVRGKVL